MKLLMVFADGFEDTEAIATIDVLKRGNITVDAVSLMDTLSVKTKCGFCLVVDKLFKDINIAEYDGIIIPGGPGSFKLMPSMDNLTNAIHYFAKNNKLVASICAAPHLVGRLGYFKGLKILLLLKVCIILLNLAMQYMNTLMVMAQVRL